MPKPRKQRSFGITEIAKAKNMRPFRRFAIHLNSGATLLIEYDEQVAVNMRDNEVFVFGPDAYHIIKPEDIASVVVPRSKP